MKIVILDGYTENPGDLSWDGFEKLGDLIVYDRTEESQIIERIGDAEIVLVNKTPLNREVFEACREMKYVGVLATGFNVIDIDAAKESGVVVSNVPTYGTDAVSQFVFALLLEICHNVGHHSKAVHAGRWTNNQDWCFWDFPLIELAGKTMGIIGLGRIGKKTSILAQAFGMKVIAYDAYQDHSLVSDNMRYVQLDELYSTADVIVLHCPLTPQTEKMINEESISKMKDGVILINNSRGQLIDEDSLARALQSKKVYAAGLDVVSTEPILESNPLLGLENCYITPHISWAPKEARQRLMDIAVENLKVFLSGNPQNVVNMI